MDNYTDPKQIGKLNYTELYKTNPELVKTLVKKRLSSGLVRVLFKKVNGEFRDMLCTNDSRFIPPAPVAEDKVLKIVRKENEGVCRVFDVNKNEWRSFKWENLIDIKDDYSDKMYLTETISTGILDK